MFNNRLRGRVPAAVAAVVLAVALGTAAVAAASATADPAATDSPQVDSDAADATVRVALEEAPEGLAGYNLELSVDAGTITGASYPDHYEPTSEPIVSADGRSVTIEAADLEDAVTANASDVTLATIQVSELDGETPSVSVVEAQIDADGGDRIDPDAVTLSVDGPSGGDGEESAQDDGSEGSSNGNGDGDGTSGATGPGFGIGAAALALGVIVLLARRD